MAEVILNYLRAPGLEPTSERINVWNYDRYDTLVDHISVKVYGEAPVVANGNAATNQRNAHVANGNLPGIDGVEYGSHGRIAVMYNTSSNHRDIPLRSQPYYAFALLVTEINAYPV